MQKIYKVNDLSELDAVAKEILSEYSEDRIFALEGVMGAGKTTFARSLCGQLGCENEVCSPTFAIVNVYFSEKEGEIYHFDFYRLNSVAEALEIGTEEYFYSGNYCFLEWSERVLDILPESYVTIKIEVVDENQRLITVNS